MHPQLQAIADDFGPADGFPLGRLWIISPFDPRIRYNAYACLTILPAHQHRRLWRAEQARAALPAA